MDEAHVELLARHLERVAPTLREGRRELEHVVVRLRRLETRLLTKVTPFGEVRGAHRVRHAVVLAVEELQPQRRLVNVALAERADQLVHRAQEPLGVKRRRHERVEMREVGRVAGGEGREQLGVEVAPAERLLLHLEAGKLALELRDAGVLDHFDGLGLDLGVPDLKLADLLPGCGRRAREHRGAGGGRDGSGQEAAAGYVTRVAAGRSLHRGAPSVAGAGVSAVRFTGSVELARSLGSPASDVNAANRSRPTARPTARGPTLAGAERREDPRGRERQRRERDAAVAEGVAD